VLLDLFLAGILPEEEIALAMAIVIGRPPARLYAESRGEPFMIGGVVTGRTAAAPSPYRGR
jgi:hypothetical protein